MDPVGEPVKRRTYYTSVRRAEQARATRTVATWVRARGVLRDDMSVDDAAAVLWTLTSPEVHRMLRADCGWSAAHHQ